MIVNNPTALEVLFLGWTHFLPMGDQEAAVYYETADRAHMMLPDGTVRHGSWRFTTDGYHIDWENGPSADWIMEFTPGTLTYLNDQHVAVTSVSRIVPGDAAGLVV